MAFDSLLNVIGVIGGYFAIILALAVTVETLLDAVKFNPWLNELISKNARLAFLDLQRRNVTPDQAMRDISYWVPPRSQAEVKLASLNKLAEQFKITMQEGTNLADTGLQTAQELSTLMGLTRQEAYTRELLAQKLYMVRQQFDLSEAWRIARIRRIASIIGIFLAIILQLDTFSFLAPLLSPVMSQVVTNPFMEFSGMVITGFAASAGSAFWHDQLERLRAMKNSLKNLQNAADA